MTASTRLVAYSPNGGRLGLLPDAESWSASLPLNDIAALDLSYPLTGARAGLLAQAVEVAVEVHDGTSWVEPRNARYRVLESSADRSQGAADVVSYTCPGYGGIMDGISVPPPALAPTTATWDSDGKRSFLSASVGQILLTVLQEARQTVTGLAPGLQASFTSTADSSGNTWAKRITIYYEPGTSLLTILDNLAQQGQCDWWLEGRRLHVVNPDSTSTHTDKRLHADATERPVRMSRAGLLHTAILVGDDGLTWKVDNPSTPRPWGATMTVINQGGVRDAGTARTLIDEQLTSGSQPRVERTLSASMDHMSLRFQRDFLVGDWLLAPDETDVWQEMRVHQVTLSQDTDGTALAVTLNDRFIDQDVRNAKRTKGIVNGASGDAGTGSLPTSATPEGAVPAAPTGVVVGSEAYLDDDGVARAVIRVSWAPVTVDTRGNALTSVAGYEVAARRAGDAAWSTTGTVSTSDTAAGLSPMATGTAYQVRVRAFTDTVMGGWSAVVTITTASDVTPPPVPTVPVLSQTLGVLSVVWDGQGVGAETMPADLSHLDVSVQVPGDAPAPTATMIRPARRAIVSGLESRQYEVRLRSVDRSGNASNWSSAALITLEALIDVDTISDEVESRLSSSQALQQAAVAQTLATMTQLTDAMTAVATSLVSTSPYPPDEGTVDSTIWVSPDARVFVLRQ